MAFTRLNINNLYCFDDTEIDLSFTRKPVNSTIDHEFLEGRENFYFKRVCILSGANASGKTSLGRILLATQRFLAKHDLDSDLLQISDKTKDAYIEADFIKPDDCSLNRIYISFCYKDIKDTAITIKEFSYGFVKIRKKESCRAATNRLNKLFSNGITFSYSYSSYLTSKTIGIISTLDEFRKRDFHSGWHYILSENTEKTSQFTQIRRDVLEIILKTFDSTIKSVSPLIAEKRKVEGYAVLFRNNDRVLIDMDGDITNKNRMSRGTYEAVKLAHLLSSVVNDKIFDIHQIKNGGGLYSTVYFLDERMAFVHTELEKLIVTLIVSKLSRYAQFFYTTHNTDVLDLDFPSHSFTFSRKENGVTKFIDASAICKKNDRKLQNYVRNNCFGTIPDLSLLEAFLFADESE